MLKDAQCTIDGAHVALSAVGAETLPADLPEQLAAQIRALFGIGVSVTLGGALPQEELLRLYEQDKKRMEQQLAAQSKEQETQKKKDPVLYGRAIKSAPDTTIREITELSGRVVVDGMMFTKAPDVRETRSGDHIVTFDITDNDSSITCKLFIRDNSAFARLTERLHKGLWMRVRGMAQVDKYMRELLISVDDINETEHEERMDSAPEKRVELHLHTQMSAMDALVDVKEVISRAVQWGHKAVAMTASRCRARLPLCDGRHPEGVGF